MALCAAEDEKDDWLKGSPLEELWRSDGLENIDPRELEKALLDNVPYMRLGERQWRVRSQGANSVDFAGLGTRDVLFVWGEYDAQKEVKSKEAEGAVVLRLDRVSYLLYKRTDYSADEDVGVSVRQAAEGRLKDFLRKSPSKSGETLVWEEKGRRVTLESVSTKVNRKPAVEYVLVTLEPSVKRLEKRNEKRSEKKGRQKERGRGFSPEEFRKHLESIELRNAPEGEAEESDTYYGMADALAAMASFSPASEMDAHRIETHIHTDGKQLGPLAALKMRAELRAISVSKEGNQGKKKKSGIPCMHLCSVGGVVYMVPGTAGDDTLKAWVKSHNEWARWQGKKSKKSAEKLKPIKNEYEPDQLDSEWLECAITESWPKSMKVKEFNRQWWKKYAYDAMSEAPVLVFVTKKTGAEAPKYQSDVRILFPEIGEDDKQSKRDASRRNMLNEDRSRRCYCVSFGKNGPKIEIGFPAETGGLHSFANCMIWGL